MLNAACTVRRVAVVLALTFGLGLLPGCYTFALRSGAATDGASHRARGPILFWGIVGVGREAFDCPNGVSSVETERPWYSPVVSVLTLGIVTPWRADYTCARPGVAEVEADGATAGVVDGDHAAGDVAARSAEPSLQ